MWLRILEPYFSSGTVTYIIGDLEAPEGFAIFKIGDRQGGQGQPLVATDLAATTPLALRRLATLIHDHRSMHGSVQWHGSPNDPLLYLADEQFIKAEEYMYWMLRIVDVPLALSGRGYPKNFQGEIHLDVHDSLIDANSGRWVLEIKGDSLLVNRGGEGHLQLDVADFAPLFSGQQSASQLARIGALQCDDPSQIELADAAFAGPAPWVVEIF